MLLHFCCAVLLQQVLQAGTSSLPATLLYSALVELCEQPAHLQPCVHMLCSVGRSKAAFANDACDLVAPVNDGACRIATIKHSE
jgi:hypothetical protein